MTPAPVDAAIVERRLRLMRELLDDLRPYAGVTGAQLATDRTAKHVVERVLSQLIELGGHMRSGHSMPSSPSPPVRTRAVRSHSASRPRRVASSGARSTGQASKKAVNAWASSNR